MSRHEEFRWMMLRIRRMTDTWIEAIKSLAEKQNLEKRKRKKVSSVERESKHFNYWVWKTEVQLANCALTD